MKRLYLSETSNTGLALKQEYECRQLPPIELHRFGGNPSEWPEFVSNFRSRIHKKVSFNDSIRMERLLSALEGDTKYLWNQLVVKDYFMLQRQNH